MQDSLEFNTSIPLYHQLKSIILEKISCGQWKEGDKIPSELELINIYKVSRTTVRQALDDLVHQRILKRIQGKGTFVTPFLSTRAEYRLAGFTRMMQSRGIKIHSKVINFKTVPAPNHVAKMLAVENSSAVIRLQRVRMIQEKALLIDVNYLPYIRFHAILEKDFSSDSLYALLMREFKTIPTRSSQVLSAIACPSKEAQLLQVKEGSPILQLEAIVYDQNDVAFDFATSYFRSDRYKYQVEVFQDRAIRT